MKVYKFFGNRINEQKRWLNDMGMKGYKLIRVGMLSYTFKECNHSLYIYDIYLLSELSYAERKKHIEALKKSNCDVFIKSLRIEFSLLSLHLKIGKKGPKLLTSPGKKNAIAIVCNNVKQ